MATVLDRARELIALAEKATPGQWTTDTWYGADAGGWAAIGPYHEGEDGESQEPEGPVHQRAQRDAAFITAAHNSLPALAQAVVKLAEALRPFAELADECIGYPEAHVNVNQRVDELQNARAVLVRVTKEGKS